MKKTVLIAFTVIAVLLLLFSVFLCFTENVRLSSMGTKIEEKLDSPAAHVLGEGAATQARRLPGGQAGAAVVAVPPASLPTLTLAIMGK